jgi:hypothetical protein
MMAFLQHVHGGDARTDLVYFWASILTVLLPISAFVTLGFLVVRGYLRRNEADGGGAPPMRNAERGMRNGGEGSRDGSQPSAR